MGKKRVINRNAIHSIIVPIVINPTLEWPTQLPRYGKLKPPDTPVLFLIGLS